MNQKILNNIKISFYENKNSHAFLVETNNLELCLSEIKSLIVDINEIKEENFVFEQNPDIKIITPEGKEIKRNQVYSVLEEFKTFPLLLKHRYYIIVQAETMNLAASNTILKFLEEPDGDVIGFFITLNKSAMIDTIVSRCQHYKLFFDVKVDIQTELVEEFLDSMSGQEIYKKISFLNNFIGKDRNANVKILKDVKDYLIKNKNKIKSSEIKLLVKRFRLLDNVIERLLKNANQELIILDLARNWK